MQRRFYRALAGLWLHRRLYPVAVHKIVDEALKFAEKQVQLLQHAQKQKSSPFGHESS